MLQKIETLTQAEQALLDFAGDLPENADRKRAAETLREHGLPSRKVEAWHYTDLRSRFTPVERITPQPTEAEIEDWLKSARPLIEAASVHFLNGRYLEASSGELPKGVEIRRASSLGFRDAHDAVALINSLTGQPGISIEVASGMSVNNPIAIRQGVVGAGISGLRHEVCVRENASAIFVEQSSSPDALTAAVNTVVNLTLAEGARLTWVIVQEEGDETTHLAQMNVDMASSSQLDILVLNAGGKLVRREINVVSKGEDSRLDIRGVNLVGGEAHLDVTTSLLHEAANTVSTETFRNVATDRGNGVFQGQISVAQAAQKTDARMACNTLLLSDEAGFSTKPELEIFADDVQCAHGATVTDIEDDHLFYLRARGISEREARALLVKAFVEEVFDEVLDESLRDALNRRIEEWLERHG